MGIFQKLFGGGGQQHGGKLAALLQTMTADLHLDANQVNAFKSAFQQFREERQQVKSSGGDRSMIKQAREKMTSAIMGVLNDQQKQLFSQNAAKYDSILHGDAE